MSVGVMVGLPRGECDTFRVSWAGIGERIAVYRRRRGLSQAALAGLIGRSESWLSQVERGIQSVDRLSVLLDIARVLHVDVGSLIGRPWRLAPNGGVVVQGLDAVRQVLTRQLQQQGFTVRQARDRDAALVLSRQHQEIPILLIDSLRMELLPADRSPEQRLPC